MMNFNWLTAEGETPAGSPYASLIIFIPLILLFVFLYFTQIKPQKKREKEVAQMRAGILVGDVITTIGGIVGTVLRVKDETIVIDTAGGQKLELQRWAVRSVDVKVDEPEDEEEDDE